MHYGQLENSEFSLLGAYLFLACLTQGLDGEGKPFSKKGVVELSEGNAGSKWKSSVT